jgi:hypothetical protein
VGSPADLERSYGVSGFPVGMELVTPGSRPTPWLISVTHNRYGGTGTPILPSFIKAISRTTTYSAGRYQERGVHSYAENIQRWWLFSCQTNCGKALATGARSDDCGVGWFVQLPGRDRFLSGLHKGPFFVQNHCCKQRRLNSWLWPRRRWRSIRAAIPGDYQG